MRLRIAIFAVLLALALAGTAHAQPGCTITVQGQSIVVAGCTVVTATATATRTPVRTATPTRTATATRTPTASPTATATPVPPTATVTPVPATATATVIPATATATATATAMNTPAPTAPPAQASGAMTVNVPLLLDAVSGDARLDANNSATVWAGRVSPAGGYTQLRAMGRGDGLSLYVQALTPKAGGTFTVTLNGRDIPGTLNAADGWLYGGTGIGSRGWGAWRLVPWSVLGGVPAQGDIWPLTLTAVDGAQWQGVVRWGAPPVTGALDGAQVLSVPVAADATLGGSTDCGADDWPDYFPTWGSRSYEADAKYSTFASVQNQWDTTDWPCYSRYIAKWALPQLPAGATVTGAWLDVYYFGYAYPGPNDAQDYSPHQLTQAYQVSTAWDAAGVTWDNAPAPLENLSYTSLDWCAEGVDCRGWRSLDVTAAVQRAYADGQPDAAVLLYTAAGQYHSGRYFYTREGGAPPVVRIAYTLPGGEPTATWTPTTAPTPTTTPTALATSVPPTATSTPRATSTTTPTPQPTATATTPAGPVAGRVWYVGPAGADANAGTADRPLRSFARAWQVMQPGDTLLIQDGTYTEPIQPLVAGVAGKPVTIKAVNDGKVILDGQGKTIPLKLGDNWPGDNKSWFVVEGLVARNGTEATVRIRGDHMVLRRVSAYDASIDDNSSVVSVVWSEDILLEDLIAAGTGRKQILVFVSDRVTVRRAYTKWVRWDGRIFCNAGWPAGTGVNSYNSSNVRFENVIATGPLSDRLIGITGNADGLYLPGIEVLGSIALNAGTNEDNTVHVYPYPEGNPCNYARDYEFYPGNRTGIGLYAQGDIPAPVFRDVLAANSAQTGFFNVIPYGIGAHDGIVDHATFYNNCLAGCGPYETRADAFKGFTVTNSRVPGYQSGEGARLDMRYVDGVRTNQPLWPWPMESRGQAEMNGFSITAWAQDVMQRASQGGQ